MESPKKPRGRPPKPDAKSDAERAGECRERKRQRLAELRDVSKPPASKVLDLSGDLAAALAARKSRN